MSEEMEDLVKQYTEGLPLKIKTIEKLWDELQDNWDIEIFSEFHLKVHDLCASAGLYGYQKVSDIANQLQICLLLLSKESGMIGVIQKEEVDDLLNQLKEAASDYVVDMA
jgi:hypothetical protein